MIKMIRDVEGSAPLKQFIATNSQNQGDPNPVAALKLANWPAEDRMPDVGVYCLNAARFLSNEEPDEVFATITQPKSDPRFAEVEASCQVLLKFRSGFNATFQSSYDAHKSQFLRLEGTDAYAVLEPAYAYHGIQMKYAAYDTELKMEIAHQPELEGEGPVRRGDGPLLPVHSEESAAAHPGRGGSAGPEDYRCDL